MIKTISCGFMSTEHSPFKEGAQAGRYEDLAWAELSG